MSRTVNAKSVAEIAEQEKEWGMAQLLRTLRSPDARAAIGNLIERVAEKGDDENARRFYAWYLMAVDFEWRDESAHPRDLQPGEAAHQYEERLKDVIASWQAQESMTLWTKLPASRSGKVEHYNSDRDYTHSTKQEFATLPKLKQAVLETIAARWAATRHEAEADGLFDFLVKLESPFQEDRKILEGVFREATDKRFRQEWALRYILRYADAVPRGNGLVSDRRVDPVPLLMIAYARNSATTYDGWRVRFTDLLRIERTLDGASRAARELVIRVAAQAGEDDAIARDLCATLAPGGYIGDRRGWKAEAEYPKVGALTVLVTLTSGPSGRKLDENWCHDQFAEAKRLVVAWRDEKKRSGAILLKMVMPRAHSAEPYFLREQLID